jgi:hypothetical protein
VFAGSASPFRENSYGEADWHRIAGELSELKKERDLVILVSHSHAAGVVGYATAGGKSFARVDAHGDFASSEEPGSEARHEPLKWNYVYHVSQKGLVLLLQ